MPPEPAVKRATAFMDGQNLFHAARESFGAPTVLSRSQVDALLRAGGVRPDQIQKMLDFLLWFGFLGVYVRLDEEHYSYQFQHNLAKMQNELKGNEGFCVHPAFRRALGCMEI